MSGECEFCGEHCLDCVCEDFKMFECFNCRLWNEAAKSMGFANGMCEECFNESFVLVNLKHEVNCEKLTIQMLKAQQ